MVGRIIKGPDCLAEGAAWLVARDSRFGTALALTGPVPLRRDAGGFADLLSAIAGQQVSVASANAVIAKLGTAGLTQPAAIVVATEAELRACGLSRQKIRYVQALAAAGLDYDALALMPDDEVVRTLVALPGIGFWTAEIYAMFSLGRSDVFAPGDLALQEAARLLFNLPKRPTEREFRVMAQDWSPWRSVAARILWAYYKVAKDREGVL